jgi:hypothetical protein
MADRTKYQRQIIRQKMSKYWVITGKTELGRVQVDFIQALLPEFPKKSNSCIIYQQNQNKRFLFLPWSQSAPSSAKKGSYKKVITISINHSLYKNIVIIVSLF